jgi:hypothetical protein
VRALRRRPCARARGAARTGLEIDGRLMNQWAAVGPVGSAAGAWRVALSREGHTGDA